MPGKNQASATPRRKRSAMKLHGPVMKAHAPEMMPQVNMMREIQRRAPTRSRIEQEVAEEEDTGAETVGEGAEAQILVHGQRGHGDVGGRRR